MPDTPPHARPTRAPSTALSGVAARDAFYSKLFTRLSIAVFLTIAASIAATAVLFNQGF
jgi:hypothetical protein